MRTKIMKSAFVSLSALLLVSACASTPEPVAQPTPQPAPAHRPAPAPSTENLAPLPPVPGSVEEFDKVTGSRVYFAYNSAQLSHEARATLSRQASWLNRYPNTRILIDGNCDERGTREYNLALGARRASAARNYLVNLGVAPSRISTISYGKERPIDGGSNERAWSVNRNAHTGIVSGANS
jgi:peptidoglycan-associated lipoprotein